MESLEQRLPLSGTPSVIELRIATSTDDAEEAESGAMYLDSTDLETVYDSYQSAGDQTVGMRFQSLGIPAGSVIHAAYVQFQVDETNSSTTSLTIRGEATDDAASFSAAPQDISSRPTTAAAVSWSPPGWNTVGEAGPNQQTPGLSAVIQEVVDRTGWTSSSSLALIVSGTGYRTAESFDGDPTAAPLLHIEYSTDANHINVRVASSADDAEEAESGGMYLNSTDLELVYDDFDSAGDQLIGLRFPSLGIPAGALIDAAHVQFQVDETSSEPTSLTIRGEASDDAASFTAATGDISSRAATAASVFWAPPAWDTVGQAGAAQRTPDLSAVIQEIVDRTGWDGASSLVLVVDGTGRRPAESYDGDPAAAPRLSVEYSTIGNRPPIAVDDFTTTPQDTPIDIDVLANDSDPNSGDTLTVAGVSQGSQGTVTNHGTYVAYTPDTGFTGDDSFTYTIADGNGESDTASVTINVRLFGSWSIVALPDTQKYSEFDSLSYQFEDQTNWIADNIAARNIVFVSHEGDIVDDGGDTAQWQRALRAMDVLDGDLQAHPDGLVPYSAVIGNHDYQVVHEPSSGSDNYVQYFGPSRYAGRGWYGGSSPNQLNHYQLIDAGGYTFLHLGLEWEAEGTPNDPTTALGWAQSILDQFPYTPAILTTHSYLWDEPGLEGHTPTPQTPGGNSGEQIFQQLVRPNRQIFLTFNGHWHQGSNGQDGEYHQVSTNQAGLPVYEMLANYQDYANGGEGWLRTVDFQPGGGSNDEDRILVETYSPTLDRYQTDADSRFSFDLDFGARFDLTGGTNVAPHALADSASTDVETAVTIEVLRNDFDPNPGDTVTLNGFIQGSHGTVNQNGSALVYTPNLGFVGQDTFSYTITDTNGGTASGNVTVTVGDSTRTATFQNGQDGYAGTADTMLQEAAPSADHSATTELNVDTDDPPGTGNFVQSLLRFDEIVGTDPGQVPPGATVLSAWLALETTNEGDGATLHRMLQSWSDMATWDTLGAGVQADGLEASAEYDQFTGFVPTGIRELDVTSGVQAWVNGQDNFGWALLPVDYDGWDFLSSEGSNPPRLTVEFDAATRTLLFQDGLNGYSGTVDTLLQEATPDAEQSGTSELNVDTEDPVGTANEVQALLRFDNVVGDATSQIPPGATIVSASLTLATTNEGDGATVHRMLQPWADTDTWNSRGAGVQADGHEARSAIDLATGFVQTGVRQFDVTASVQAWANGETNNGWAFLPVDFDGWDFHSAEGVTKPLLTVTYTSVTSYLFVDDAGGVPPSNGSGDSSLTSMQLDTMADHAVWAWTGAGITPAEIALLDQVTVEVADLPRGSLGRTFGTRIQVDRNAAGYGWYVDPAEDDDAEYRHLVGGTELRAASGAPAIGVDLQTVLMHEMGHLLGLDDRPGTGHRHELMRSTLPPGTRRLPAGSVPVWSADDSVVLERIGNSGALRVTVLGTRGDDRFTFRAGTLTHGFVINGQEYAASAEAVASVKFRGLSGDDFARLEGSSGDETARLLPARGTLTGPDFRVDLANVETIHVLAVNAGGTDRAFFFDSPGNDRFVARAHKSDAYMVGAGFHNYARGFDRNSAIARAGGENDRAWFFDSSGDDRYVARAHKSDAYMVGAGFRNYARGFDRNSAIARAGGENDRAWFFDSRGDDRFVARAYRSEAIMAGADYFNYARGFDGHCALARAGGNDRAFFYDTSANERFDAGPDWARLRGNGVSYCAKGLDRVSVTSRTTDDVDRVYYYNSAGSVVNRDTFDGLVDYVFWIEDDWRS